MNDKEELQAQQREVERLLGRCLLGLQQYEHLMKAIAAHHEIAGPAHELEKIQTARIDDASTKTLGTLVGQLFGSFIVSDACDIDDDAAANEPDNVLFFSMRMRLTLSAEDYLRRQSDLKELVLLRNNLVHHFIDQHDLWSTDGCRSARDALVEACSRTGQQLEQLRVSVKRLDKLRREVLELMRSDAYLDWIINGVAPDGTVHWPAAGIVRALREAANELAIDGWTPVAAAGRWITERTPDQRPDKYGCASWRQVLHESRLFDLRYRDVDGQRSAWYRVRHV